MYGFGNASSKVILGHIAQFAREGCDIARPVALAKYSIFVAIEREATSYDVSYHIA